MRKVLTLFRLTSREKGVFLIALYWLAYYRLSLRNKRLTAIFAEVEKSTARVPRPTGQDLPAARVCQLITSAAKYVPRSTCFSKALAGKVMLARYGYHPALKIGVAKDSATELAAHAWLTLGEKVILCNLPDIGRYQEIETDAAALKGLIPSESPNREP